MITSLVLITGQTVRKESLLISLTNAKQLVTGNAPDFGWVVHVAANTGADLSKALLSFSKINGVEGITTLAIHSGA